MAGGYKPAAALGVALLWGCSGAATEGSDGKAVAAQVVQEGQGKPYALLGSEVWDVPDPVSGRVYQVFVSLPSSYAKDPQRAYPVLYVTDADYAFPVVRQIARRLNVEGPKVQEFILVGLSYAKGDDPVQSRRRDYTPTAEGPSDAPADAVHGGGAAYQTYLRDQAMPFVARRYRTDSRQNCFSAIPTVPFWGHRYCSPNPKCSAAISWEARRFGTASGICSRWKRPMRQQTATCR